ncbi:MAG: transcription initiation factor IIB family protein [Halobacteriales archaeon]|nr:transcription initiation factor IIB family protein [Halobacteriales archaeon]
MQIRVRRDVSPVAVVPLEKTELRRGTACPECDGRIREEAYETVCADCGLVVGSDFIDRGPEWRRSENDVQSRLRVGRPITPSRHDRGLTTEIGLDAVYNGNLRRRLSGMRREHARSKFGSKDERNLADALGQIARINAALELSFSTRERASRIYRDGRRLGMLPGRSIDTLAAASVYAACRCGGLVRTLGEVAAVAQCSVENVEAGYRLLNHELGLAARLVDLEAYVSRLVSGVEGPEPVRRRALELAAVAEADGLHNGRHPGGLAAACVYIAGHEHGQLYTQDELASIADVSTATIRSRRKELRELLD